MSNLEWLQNWYQAQCNGDWEHQYGIKIETLDNPGWSVLINLENTKFSGIGGNTHYERSETDWLTCRISNNCFEGFGDSQKLDEILGIFKTWIQKIET